MQKQLFRQYDIRGKIGTEIAIDDFYYLTHAILAFFMEKGCSAIVVGMDGRTHSFPIFQQILAACKDAGIDVHFLGVCSTPVTVFAQYYLPVQGSLMITASHNAGDYNGLKIYNHHVAVAGENLQQIYELFLNKVIIRSDKMSHFFDATGMVDTYLDSLMMEFDHLKNFSLPVYIDCGNGTGGPLVRRLIEKMSWQHVQILCEEVDGTYPHHIADPTDIENVQDLLAAVEQHPGSFGIGLDGDCDRLAVVTRIKKLVTADQLLTLFAQSIQAKIIVADIKSSSVLQHAGAQVVLAKTGCANIKTVMAAHSALIGGELSGHFFFKDRHLGYDDGIYGMLRFFEILYRQSLNCDELIGSLPELFTSKDMRIPCSDLVKFDIVEMIKLTLMQDTQFVINDIDGVRFESQDGWGLIRASNTQPALSVCCQASSAQGLQGMKKLLISLLKNYIDPLLLEKYIV